jgi:hypothetical protein
MGQLLRARAKACAAGGAVSQMCCAFAVQMWLSSMPCSQVLLVVRGTTSLADALTDLSGHLVPFGGGSAKGDMPKEELPEPENAKAATSSGSSSSTSTAGTEADEPEGMAHNGILRAAKSLLHEQGPTLGQLLRDNPGYRLKVWDTVYEHCHEPSYHRLICAHQRQAGSCWHIDQKPVFPHGTAATDVETPLLELLHATACQRLWRLTRTRHYLCRSWGTRWALAPPACWPCWSATMSR